MKQILIVEDDRALNWGILFALKKDQFHFFQAYSIAEAKMAVSKVKFDLILLDINLPDGNGLDFCRELRAASQIPIIFLTANDLELDIVTGFELGADDYITKPFSLAVLRARVMAVLRRSTSENIVTLQNLSLDFDQMIFRKDGQEILFSKTEQKLLRLLVMNCGITLSREKLMDALWSDGGEFVDENALSVAIRRLRQKLEDNPSAPKWIQTIYGVGYRWEEKKHE